MTTTARQREKLTRDRVIDAALRVMDGEGLDAVDAIVGAGFGPDGAGGVGLALVDEGAVAVEAVAGVVGGEGVEDLSAFDASEFARAIALS